jgi:hypothetical protein
MAKEKDGAPPEHMHGTSPARGGTSQPGPPNMEPYGASQPGAPGATAAQEAEPERAAEEIERVEEEQKAEQEGT